jgi:hypothetical protein
MANMGAVIAGAFGGKINPQDLIPTFDDERDTPTEEELKHEEEIQAQLRAADQRAFLAALKAATPKTNGT